MSDVFAMKVSAGAATGDNTEARAFKVESSLSRKMAQPGGLSVAQIERRAKERLMCHKIEAMRSIAKAVATLDQLAEEAEHDPAKLYRIASEMLDLAGFFDTGPLYDAGYSLCETVEAMQASNDWNRAAIKVHVDALKLVLADDCLRTDVSAQLLEGLKAVLQHARGQ